ncbi:MAG: HU family DNA-binding protein [Treponema brennaborense]|nr:HU family DNA-binding protein [Muribaculaceae bacterium]MCM1408119.1 HU family DNA-binding protein [Treponema brennaborense]
MSIAYYSRKRINPQDLETEPKFYPAPFYISEVGINKIGAEISESMSLTKSDVIAVINGLLEAVPKYLMMGYKVRLENFGRFRISFSAPNQAFENAENVNAEGIGALKILFSPDPMLKDKLKKPDFVKIDARFLPPKDSEVSEQSEAQGEEVAAEAEAVPAT